MFITCAFFVTIKIQKEKNLFRLKKGEFDPYHSAPDQI